MSRPTQWTVQIRRCANCGHYTDGTAERTENGCGWCAAEIKIYELEQDLVIKRRQLEARDDRLRDLERQLQTSRQELGEDIITGAVQRLELVLAQWREQEGIRPPPPAAVTEAPPSE